MRVVADVKCYYCGHVSGQVVGEQSDRLRLFKFLPRPGYGGGEPAPGQRIRCERCSGPTYLEDLSPYEVAPQPHHGPRQRTRRARPSAA